MDGKFFAIIFILWTVLIIGSAELADASKKGKQMSGQLELYHALKIASEHLNRSDDSQMVEAVYRSPADQMRRAADLMDRKDADIAYVRSVLGKYQKLERYLKK